MVSVLCLREGLLAPHWQDLFGGGAAARTSGRARSRGLSRVGYDACGLRDAALAKLVGSLLDALSAGLLARDPSVSGR